MPKYYKIKPETLWEDEKGFCKIIFYPDDNKMFFEVGSLMEIVQIKLSLGNSFIKFLNDWHEFKLNKLNKQ